MLAADGIGAAASAARLLNFRSMAASKCFSHMKSRTSCISTVMISPAVIGQVLDTAEVPALQRTELPDTSVTGLLFSGKREHCVPYKEVSTSGDRSSFW